jgi:hypothetical protein
MTHLLSRRSLLPLLAAALLALPLGLTACGGEKTHTIDNVREIQGTGGGSMKTVGSQDRFGGAAHGGAVHGGAAMGAGGPRWSYETPEGWKLLPPRPMRDVGWDVPGGATCTFSALPGSGGGLLANVNRWRKQMGLEDIDEAGLAAMEDATLMGQAAKVVDLEGTYGGMGGTENVEGAKMLGLIADLPGAALFLKLTGPAEAVEAARGGFEQVAASLRPAPMAGEGMPPGHGMRPSSGEAATERETPLGWDAPAGWAAQGPRPFREETFNPEGRENTEAWISVLVGDGGGLVENINRWRGQMGQSPLSAAEVENLPTLESMGIEGTLVTIHGSYNAGMGGGGGRIEDATMLGYALLRGDDSVFVKMVGPTEDVLAEKENFEALCRSLRKP